MHSSFGVIFPYLDPKFHINDHPVLSSFFASVLSPLLHWPIPLLSSVDSYFTVCTLNVVFSIRVYSLGLFSLHTVPKWPLITPVTWHHLLTVKTHSGQLCSSEFRPPLPASQASLLVLNISHRFSTKVCLSEWWDRVQPGCCRLLFFFSSRHPIDR